MSFRLKRSGMEKSFLVKNVLFEKDFSTSLRYARNDKHK